MPVSSINATFLFCSEMVIDSISANVAYLEPYRLQDRNRTLDPVTTSGDSAYASLNVLNSACHLVWNWLLPWIFFLFTCNNRHCYVFRVVPEAELSMSKCVYSADNWSNGYYHKFTTDPISQSIEKKKRKEKEEIKRSILFLAWTPSLAIYSNGSKLHEIWFSSSFSNSFHKAIKRHAKNIRSSSLSQIKR